MPRALPFLFALAALSGEAAAGAWTRAESEIFTAQSVRFFTTELTGDTDTPFRRVSTDSYLEYGLTDAITLGGELRFGQRLDGVQEGEVKGFLRARLYKGDSDVASVEIGGGFPVIDGRTPLDLTRDTTAEGIVRASYGRGFQSEWGGGWLDASIAFRHRSGPPADELRLDLTAGLRPTENWVLLAQSFSTLGLRNNGFTGADFDVVKFSASVGYRITETRTLLLSATQDAFGRNINLGTEVAVTIWTLF